MSMLMTTRDPMADSDQDRQVRVVEKRSESEGVVSLTLAAADDSALPQWTPGAHIDVHLAEGVVRQYSLCGQLDDEHWRIAVLREPAGRGGSVYIHDRVGTGDLLTVRGPRNNFALEPAAEYLFVAGGIGITPILSMIHAVVSAGGRARLLYGGRTQASMAFVAEVTDLLSDAVEICPQDVHGHLNLSEYLASSAAGTKVYACGPGPLLDALGTECAGLAAGTLHTERFAPSRTRTGPQDAFVVELARSGRRLVVPKYESMLEVLNAAGCEVVNSCTAGICGTCLTPVIAGIPEHNDDVLTDEERDSNTMMLPCVSRARTDIITVDL